MGPAAQEDLNKAYDQIIGQLVRIIDDAEHHSAEVAKIS